MDVSLIGLYLLVYLFGFSAGLSIGKLNGYSLGVQTVRKMLSAALKLEHKLALVGKSIKDLTDQELSKKLNEIIKDDEPSMY